MHGDKMIHVDKQFEVSLCPPYRWENWEPAGAVLVENGQLGAAREHYLSKVKNYRIGSNHLALAAALVRLAGVYMEGEQWYEAQKYLRMGIRSAQAQFGEQSAQIHCVIRRYAFCLRKLSEQLSVTLVLPLSLKDGETDGENA